jgi:predicted RNA-binding Zn-ribbon protein involved in translation (DUF1610 family)
MKQIALSVALVALFALLAWVLVTLIQVSRQGFTINVTGTVSLVDSETGVSGEVNLVMPEPVNLIATGPGLEPVPTNLSFVPCPKCGGSMLPIRFNLFTGEIEWRCLDCGYSSKEGYSP